MSTSQRVQLLSSGAEQLAVLSEYLKNSKLIAQLQDEVKALNSLTADEEAKVAQARKDLRDHVGKMDILQTSMEELAKAQEAHKAQSAIYAANIEAAAKALSLEKQSIIDKETAHKETAKQLAEERKQLDFLSSSSKRESERIMQDLLKREDVIKAREDKVTSAEIALVAQKKKLEDKLKLLSE